MIFAKANQIFGFIQHKAVFVMLFSRVKQCDVKVWQKFFTIRQFRWLLTFTGHLFRISVCTVGWIVVLEINLIIRTTFVNMCVNKYYTVGTVFHLGIRIIMIKHVFSCSLLETTVQQPFWSYRDKHLVSQKLLPFILHWSNVTSLTKSFSYYSLHFASISF